MKGGETMAKYNFKVYFKIEGEPNIKYNMQFTIEAETNQIANVKGALQWSEQVDKREKLKNARVVKTTCRKKESKPRKRKTPPLKKALAELNAYLIEELSD